MISTKNRVRSLHLLANELTTELGDLVNIFNNTEKSHYSRTKAEIDLGETLAAINNIYKQLVVQQAELGGYQKLLQAWVELRITHNYKELK